MIALVAALCLLPASGERVKVAPGQYDVLWAVSDVHGRRAAFDKLLAGAGLVAGGQWNPASRRQLLIVAGDFMNGDATWSWLREIQLGAEAAGSRVIMLRGNHEPASRGLPVAATVGTWLFVHGGLDAESCALPGGRRWWASRKRVAKLKARLEALGLDALIFGHEPDALGAPGTIARRDWAVKLDAGMKAGAPGLLLRCSTPLALQRCEVIGADGVRHALETR